MKRRLLDRLYTSGCNDSPVLQSVPHSELMDPNLLTRSSLSGRLGFSCHREPARRNRVHELNALKQFHLTLFAWLACHHIPSLPSRLTT